MERGRREDRDPIALQRGSLRAPGPPHVCDLIMGHIPEPPGRQGFRGDVGGPGQSPVAPQREAPSTASAFNMGDSLVPTGYSSSHMERKMSAMACTVFNELRLEGKLCDVIISVDGIEFNAHKNILCSCSHYFRSVPETRGDGEKLLPSLRHIVLKLSSSSYP
ncbi:kelch-like protein diablo [Mycteria americana]|uniref:kelch-like protein diablo n=1 Tax=Mycteria americana TaxID=33587 RepID=UPI003F581705